MIRELHTQSTPFGEDLDPGDDSDLPGRSLPRAIPRPSLSCETALPVPPM